MFARFTPFQAFLYGAASVLNLSGQSPIPIHLHESAEAAMRSDFEQVGDLLRSAMNSQPVTVKLVPEQLYLPGVLNE